MSARPRLLGAFRLGQGAFNSAFSTGPGYEPQPLNERAQYQSVERYYLDLRAKTRREIEHVVNGHGHVLPRSATNIAQSALGWWERHLDGELDATALFAERAEGLRGIAEPMEDALLWAYEVPVPKYEITGRWYSAMAQGQAASVFVRAHLCTGDARYAEAAIAAVRAITAHGEKLGITRPLLGGIAFEECSTDRPSLILNGWIFALWGMHDVGAGLGRPEFRDAFAAGARTLAATVCEYDLGWWSRYSLYEPQAPDIAKPSYHALHADQLTVMHRLTGIETFASIADRWRAQDTVANRARAVALKGRAVLGARRRHS